MKNNKYYTFNIQLAIKSGSLEKAIRRMTRLLAELPGVKLLSVNEAVWPRGAKVPDHTLEYARKVAEDA